MDNDETAALEPMSCALDYEELLSRLSGNRPFALRILREFLETTPALLSKLRECVAMQDTFAAKRHAHSLKGAAATIAAPRLRCVALQAEQSAAAAAWGHFDELLPRIEDELERLGRAIATA